MSSLNVRNIGGKVENLEPGSYPARLVQVVDLGLQPQSFKGEEKKPLREIYLTYELSDEFMKDEDNQPIKDKPRWLSESFPLHNIKSEKAKSTERYKSLDPAGAADGDFTKLLGNPLMITVVNNTNNVTKRTYDNVAGTQGMRTRDIEKLAPLVNKPMLFLLDDPDLGLFLRLPPFVQKRIRSNMEYAGSKLEVLLKESEEHSPPKAEVAVAGEVGKSVDDEQPY
jgi:hypothetical protein